MTIAWLSATRKLALDVVASGGSVPLCPSPVHEIPQLIVAVTRYLPPAAVALDSR
ncbi:hypothetical protein [Streptosporangium sp. KLBMP 9127]|nr:hypothetical protein [Streptosporangium sp. KLBMP 9127]